MINTMVNPISYKDKNGVYLGINESFSRRLFGLPEEKVIGHTLPEVCTIFVETFPERSMVSGKCFTDICKEWDKLDKHILKSGGNKTHEQEVTFADGTSGIFLVNRSTFRDENGEVMGLVTVLQDITELRMSEKVLRRMRSDIESLPNRQGSSYTITILTIINFLWQGLLKRFSGMV